VENLTIKDRKFKNPRMELMWSFKVEDLERMYHIADPQDICDSSYLANFAKKNEEPFKMIQGLRILEKRFKFNKTGMYPIVSLVNPYNYVAAMLCRLYRLHNNAKIPI